MPQPPAYNRTKDFTEDFGSETDHSSLNTELDTASNSINDIRANLAILQADDGKLNPDVVTTDSISADVRNDLSAGILAAVGSSVTDAAASADAAALSATNLATAVTQANASKVAAAASEAAALASKNASDVNAASALASKNTTIAAEANVVALAATVASNKTETDNNAASALANKLASDTNAATAATQAGIATTQAGIATTKAGEAATSAAAAATFDPALYLAKAGNETKSGVLTFTDSPLVPEPTAANQASSMGYVDGGTGTAITTTGTTLTNVAARQFIDINSATATTTTLMASSSLLDGQSFTLTNIGAGIATFNRAGSDTITGCNLVAATSISLNQGETVTLSKVNGTFRVTASNVTFFGLQIVRLLSTNGYGSTNTVIRRFLTVDTNQGSDIAYADSATLGAYFTINTAGVYAISYTDSFSVTADMGLSVNSSQLTTGINSITAANRLSNNQTGEANFQGYVGATKYFSAGDVVRAHTGGTSSGATNSSSLTIVRVK